MAASAGTTRNASPLVLDRESPDPSPSVASRDFELPCAARKGGGGGRERSAHRPGREISTERRSPVQEVRPLPCAEGEGEGWGGVLLLLASDHRERLKTKAPTPFPAFRQPARHPEQRAPQHGAHARPSSTKPLTPAPAPPDSAAATRKYRVSAGARTSPASARCARPWASPRPWRSRRPRRPGRAG